ncbi:MAG TPA: hypothetical protein VF587_15330 [Solirubrobacteraceae bacterium]
MLSDDFSRAFRDPGPLVLALACGMALGIFGGAVTSGGDEPENGPATTVAAEEQQGASPEVGGESGDELPPPASDPSPPRGGPGSSGVSGIRLDALRAVERRYGGVAEAAVWVGGWQVPTVYGDAKRKMRMWSISKPVTAIAALRATPGGKPSAALAGAIEKALVESHNCAQRRVVLGLQTLTKKGPAGAQAAFDGVLADAGVRATPANVGSAIEDCAEYFSRPGTGGVDTGGNAAQFGTSEWTIVDAVTFARALGARKFGAPGDRVLELLRREKLVSEEQKRTGFTVPADWGAGRALGPWEPSYKAGWGGEHQREFMAAQIVTFPLQGQQIAIAVAFHPDKQPTSDDPGSTTAPAAVERMLRIIGAQVQRAAQG